MRSITEVSPSSEEPRSARFPDDPESLREDDSKREDSPDFHDAPTLPTLPFVFDDVLDDVLDDALDDE